MAAQGKRGQGERVVSGGLGTWGTGASDPRILLVGTPATLYEKKVHVLFGSRARGCAWPFGLTLYVTVAICGLLWLVSSQSSAQGIESVPSITTWAVRVAAGGRCEGSDAFAEALAAQIPVAQRAPVDQAELVAEVLIDPSGVAHIRVFDRVLQSEAGSRELQLSSRSCGESAEAVSLVLAVLVEAGRGALRTAPTPAPTAPPTPPLPVPPPPSPPPPPPPPPPPAPRPRAQRHVWLGPRAGHDLNVAVGLSGGLLPAPAPGATVGWGIRGAKAWPVWLQLTGYRKHETSALPVRIQTLYASVLGCPFGTRWKAVRARACLGASLGAVWNEGRRVGGNNEKVTSPVGLIGIELAASVSLVGPLEFTVLGRGDVSLLRTETYYIAADGSRRSLYEPKFISGALFAGLALRFR